MQSIINEIYAYIQQVGGTATEWYVGIASDPRARLFSDHCVTEVGDVWIYRDTGSETTARAVEQAFLNSGYSGGGGGGGGTTRYVYAYKITNTTRE